MTTTATPRIEPTGDGSTDAAPATLWICTGKHCRRDPGFDELIACAAGLRDAREVPCQDICKGPAVGITIGSTVHWFAKIRTPTLRAKMLKALRTGAVGKRLHAREATKRCGRVVGARRAQPLRRQR